MPPREAIKEAAINPNQALWEKGDFTRIAAAMRESSEGLVRWLSVTKGMKVLDLGCGDGTTALPATQSAAPTCWVSTSRANLVEAGNRGAGKGPRGTYRFQDGDGADLRGPARPGLRPRGLDLRRDVRAQPFDVAREMVG